jgi:hypothetical protein
MIQMSSVNGKLDIKKISGNKIDMIINKPIYAVETTNKLDFRFNTEEFQVASASGNVPHALELPMNGIKASKIDIVADRPIYNTEYI